MKYLKPIFWLLLFIIMDISGQNYTNSLDPEKKIHQYNFDYWTTTNGLPTNSLLHIYQSKNGYLWLTGYGGIIRFDGFKFTIFNKKNTPEFSSNIIGRIAEDSTGTLWFTTQESGLISLQNGVFASHGKDIDVRHLYRALYIDKNNTIWSASPEKGWFYFKEGKFTFLNFDIPLANIEVRTICAGKNGEIYFGTLGKGLFKYKNGELLQINYNNTVSNFWIYSLHLDDTGALWVGTSNGLKIFNGKIFTNSFFNIKTDINAITEDRWNNIWLGTKDGIYRINNKKQEYDSLSKQGQTHSYINDMTFDYEGNLWLTKYKGGITRIKNGKFTNYSQNDGLSGKTVNAICEIDPNKFLIGFDYGKINILMDGKIDVFKTKYNIENKRVRYIFKDSQKNIWISTYDGLLKIKPDGTEKLFYNSEGFEGSKIRLTFEDNAGNLWVGTRNNGAIKIEPSGKIKNFNANNGLSSMLVMSINQSPDNKIFIGTNDGGINILENDSIITIIDKNDGLPSDVIFNTYIDKEGLIWVALNGGLSCIKQNKIYSIGTKDGLFDDSPFSIIEDEQNNLWMPSLSGIMKINKNELLHYFDHPEEPINCQLYNNNDGMLEEECNATAQSIKASDGSLLFATINGVSKINPSVNLINNYVPPVFIESLKINGQKVNLKNNIVVQPGKSRLTFEYTSLSKVEPIKNQFKYKLEGYDDNWINSENQRTVSYTNIPPGSYTFKVIGSNNDQAWNNIGDSVTFFIKPLFIQTWLFYILVFIIVFIIVFSIYQLKIRQFKKQQQVLEEKVALRTQEISLKNKELEEQKQEIQSQAETLSEQKKTLEEVLATKNKMFSIIAHDLRSPMGNFQAMLFKLVDNPDDFSDDRRNKLLGILAENAKNTFTLLENLLNWSKSQMGVISFNPKNFYLAPLASNIITLIEPFAQNKNIDISLKINQELQVFADEDMIKTVFRNLIMNAVKFTNDNGHVKVSSQVTDDYIQVSIHDNGIGLSNDLMDSLFQNQAMYTSMGTHNERGSGLGLILCKEFIERNGGKIWVESVENVGSTFYFTLKTPNL